MPAYWTGDHHEQSIAVFMQLTMGEALVTQTARYARQVLERWPEQFEHPVAAEARIEMFVDGIAVDPVAGDAASSVFNRALGSSDRVEEHSELAGRTDQELLAIWLALVFGFDQERIAQREATPSSDRGIRRGTTPCRSPDRGVNSASVDAR